MHRDISSHFQCLIDALAGEEEKVFYFFFSILGLPSYL
jgi:hypothetical protein